MKFQRNRANAERNDLRVRFCLHFNVSPLNNVAPNKRVERKNKQTNKRNEVDSTRILKISSCCGLICCDVACRGTSVLYLIFIFLFNFTHKHISKRSYDFVNFRKSARSWNCSRISKEMCPKLSFIKNPNRWMYLYKYSRCIERCSKHIRMEK